MRTWIAIAGLACVAAIMGVTLVSAQPPPPPDAAVAPQTAPPGPPRERPGEGPRAGMMEDKELREMVETVMTAKLTTRLGLTDEQALQLVRCRSKAREDAQKLNKQRREKMKEIESAIKGDKPDDAEINAKLGELLALDEKIAGLRRQAFEEAGKNLSAVQRAKLYYFINEFENDMRQLIARARNSGMAERPGLQGGPGPRDGGPGMREGIREQFRENMRRNGAMRPRPPEGQGQPNPAPPNMDPQPEPPAPPPAK